MKRAIETSVWVLACWTMTTSAVVAQETPQRTWTTGDPVFLPGPAGSFDEVAVKDPSIVFAQGMWHLFYTARSRDQYSTGYVCAPRLQPLQSASRHQLRILAGNGQYACAPQVFYFEPQSRWYLIFQTREANYQPTFCTTTTLTEPDSWSPPTPLLAKDTAAKWIDFWVICDASTAYLFYTQAHRSVMVRSTSLEAFPHGWGPAREVFAPVHEAVHIYKVKGRDTYHMIYELNEAGVRSFGLATAETLVGPWTRVTNCYATGGQLQYSRTGKRWAEMVSHGELIRAGFDQRMEYEPQNLRWLFQGLRIEQMKGPYESLPWKLGIMANPKGDLP